MKIKYENYQGTTAARPNNKYPDFSGLYKLLTPHRSNLLMVSKKIYDKYEKQETENILYIHGIPIIADVNIPEDNFILFEEVIDIPLWDFEQASNYFKWQNRFWKISKCITCSYDKADKE